MAAPLAFRFRGREFVCRPDKVDRSRLYGYVETEAVDEHGERCALATLAPDGRTLIGSGGTALVWLTPDGDWIDKTELRPVDPEGEPVETPESSFKKVNEIENRVSPEVYLAHTVHAVYRLLPDEGGALDAELVAELKAGAIFGFDYATGRGLSADAGFLLADADGEIWLAVGKPADIRFVALDRPVAPDEEPTDEETGEDDEVDFGML